MTSRTRWTERTTAPRARNLAAEDRSVLITIAVAAAVAFVGAWFPAPDSPRVGQASAQEVRDWVTANATALLLTAVALLLVALAFLVIASGLAALARRHLGHGILTDLLLASGTVVAILLTLDTGASTLALLLPGLVDTTLTDVSDQVIVGWLGIGGYTHLLGDLQIAFVASALACGSLIARRLGLVNRWLAYGGLAISASAGVGALAIVTSIAALYPLWFIGTFGLYLALAVLAVAALLAARVVGRSARTAGDPSPTGG